MRTDLLRLRALVVTAEDESSLIVRMERHRSRVWLQIFINSRENEVVGPGAADIVREVTTSLGKNEEGKGKALKSSATQRDA